MLGGRTCRSTSSRWDREDEPLEVKLEHDQIVIERGGRRLRALRGEAAAELRRVLEEGDHVAVQRLAARMVTRA